VTRHTGHDAGHHTATPTSSFAARRATYAPLTTPRVAPTPGLRSSGLGAGSRIRSRADRR
jgi:hypothetical protein